MQYKAGYFLNSIFDLFLNQSVKEKVEKLVFQLCHFNLETNDDLTHQQVNSSAEIKTIHNLIVRGAPTRPGVAIENMLSDVLGKTKKEITSHSNITYPFINDSLTEEIYRALHIIDPRINKSNQLKFLSKRINEKESDSRVKFRESLYTEYLSEAFIQLIEEDRDYKSIIRSNGFDEDEEVLKNFESILTEKNDFALEMPYEVNKVKGICFEINESPAETKYKHEVEQLKKSLGSIILWADSISLDNQKLAESNAAIKPLINFTYNEYFDIILKNYRNPLYSSTSSNIALHYALSPILIARIQKTVIEYLLSGKLSLDDKEWKIAVIERDVSAAAIAFKDLMQQFENLFLLKGKNKKLPDIKLSVFCSEEFKESKLNSISEGIIHSFDQIDKNIEYDLLLDVSILQRYGIKNKDYQIKAKNRAIISSVRSINGHRMILSDEFIQYCDLLSSKPDDISAKNAQSALKYFLRNIFRKESFLPGQIELINKCFRGKNILGILPATGGKTIAYQLASLLQPGLAIIINPISSLAIQQIDDLKKAGIDIAGKLNASDNSKAIHTKKLNKLKENAYSMLYISPENLRNTETRKAFSSLYDNKFFFSYFIIDEAHCLSEWSHDFKFTYNKLGELKEQIIFNKNKQKIPTIALSSTVSNATQNDIQSELMIEPEDVLRINRQTSNIKIKIIEISANQAQSEMSANEIRERIGKQKQIQSSFLINEIFPEEKDRNKENTSLIICPDTYGFYGVSDGKGNGLADKLKNNFSKLKTSCFWGTSDFSEDTILWNDVVLSETNQKKFFNNGTNILVSTPAITTGLNKTGIKNLIFLEPPATIEDFIQQIQRVGWDQNLANCYFLINKQHYIIKEISILPEYFKLLDPTAESYTGFEKIAKKYKGKEKEITHLYEFLNEIRYEKVTPSLIIKDEIELAFGLETELIFHPQTKPSKLYISKGEKTYGYVDLSGFGINTDETGFEKKLSQQILNFVSDELKKRCDKAQDTYKTLSTEIYQNQSKGILELLDNLKTGSTGELIIPFSNNALNDLTEYLQNKLSISFTKSLVRQTYLSSLSAEHFLDKMHKLTTFENNFKINAAILGFYKEIRLKEDTRRAIYRLSKLGIIEDYLIDELNNRFIITIKKKGSEAYLIKLHEIFDSFLLSDIAKKKKTGYKIINFNFLNKAIEAYVEFCYEYIVNEKIKSVKTLNNIILQISENKENKANYNLWIQELISNYFGAKYINRFNGIIQSNRTPNSEIQNFEIIKSTLDQMSDLKEDWEQLKKSVDIVSKTMPQNPIPYLLDAYINLITSKPKKETNEAALDQIARGFIRIRKLAGFKLENYQKNIKTLLDQLYQYRPDLKEKYDPIIWLRMHYIWLKDFNKTN